MEHDVTRGAEQSAATGSPATVRAIAAEAGVSIATVSRVLNDHPAVAPATRAAVVAAAARLGGPAHAPRGRRGRDGAVCVRVPYVLDDYFGPIVSAVAETLELHGRRLVLSAGERVLGRDVLTGLPDDPGLAGAVLVLPPEPVGTLETLRGSGFPFVVVDPMTALPRDIPSVSAAHLASARALTAHLIALGHRRIGVVGGPTGWLASQARLAGHAAALAEAGLLPDPALRRDIHADADEGYVAAAELLDLPDRPTALVAFNDKAASGALRAAAERGLRVPDDLSVTGFDDLDLARGTVPPLTTVRQPLQEMGRMAVSLLLRLVSGQTVDALHVSLATELVVRGSTGPAPR